MENTIKYKKSELSELAELLKHDVLESLFNGTIVIQLTFFVKGNKTTVFDSLDVRESDKLTVRNVMNFFRKQLSNTLYLKVNKMNLKISINDTNINPNLFGIDTVFTGKKTDRYRTFNAWFIIAMGSYLGIEANPTGDEI